MEASVPVVWDLNPTNPDDNEPRKVVRGGSWKDIQYFLETGTRNFEYQDSARSYIGFPLLHDSDWDGHQPPPELISLLVVPIHPFSLSLTP